MLCSKTDRTREYRQPAWGLGPQTDLNSWEPPEVLRSPRNLQVDSRGLMSGQHLNRGMREVLNPASDGQQTQTISARLKAVT